MFVFNPQKTVDKHLCLQNRIFLLICFKPEYRNGPKKGLFSSSPMRTRDDSSLKQPSSIPNNTANLGGAHPQSPEGSRREAGLTLETQAIFCRQSMPEYKWAPGGRVLLPGAAHIETDKGGCDLIWNPEHLLPLQTGSNIP